MRTAPACGPEAPSRLAHERMDPTALLTAAEERELATRVAEGDRAARDRLVEANLRLVRHFAAAYQSRGLEFEDLVSEGCLGLIQAAQDYDPRFGTRFSSYASIWIKRTIREALSNRSRTVRVPCNVRGLLARWRRAERSLWQATGRSPGPAEVAAAAGLTERQALMVERALAAEGLQGAGAVPSGRCEDLPARSGQGDSRLAAEEASAELNDLLDCLDERERAVVELRYGLEGGRSLTLRQVGQRLGMTREWARKLERKALASLAETSRRRERKLAGAIRRRSPEAPARVPTWGEVRVLARSLAGDVA